MTREERLAVAALRRVAARWPATLTLVKHADSRDLSVKMTAELDYNDASTAREVASIRLTVESTT